MGKFRKMIDLSTEEKKQEFFELLDSKKSMKDVYKEFGLQYSNSNSSDLHKMANLVGFDLSIYKERQSKQKKYCLQCGKELIGWQTKFCSSSCSATYNNLRRGKVFRETREKISKSLKLYNKNNLNRKPKRCNICGEINCQNIFCKEKRQIINTLIKYFKFDKNILGTGIVNVKNEYNRIKTELYNLYWVDELSCELIMKKYPEYKSQNVGNFSKIFKSLNIPKRTLSEAQIVGILNNRISIKNKNFPEFKSEWHKTWDGREVYLRSSNELEYAHFLDDNRILYDVECFRIKYLDSKENIYKCALPDFYIKNENMLVEIKSIYTYDRQNMLDRFKAYKEKGYNCKLILDGNEYGDDNLPESISNNIYNRVAAIG